MNTLLPNAAFTLEANTVTVTLGSASEALAFFNWLHGEYAAAPAAAQSQGDLINRRGSVIQKSGIVQRGGVSQMIVGGASEGVVINQGDGWFDVETTNEQTFRFDAETLCQVDGARTFEFDQ